MNMKKILIILPVLIICLIFTITVIVRKMSDDARSKYLLSKVERKSITEIVEASGTINPVNTVSIGSQVSGMIKYIYVDFNSQVKKGQQLAQIDPSLFQAQVDQARSQMNSAKAEYEKTKSMLIYDEANYKRYKKLYEKNYVSKNDVELAYATYKSDLAALKAKQAVISQYKATLENNLTNLRYTKIISPVDGVVVSRKVEVGQTVAASFTTPELFIVAQDLTKMQIEVSVSEADIGKIKTGQSVDYTLDGYPNEVFKGVVSQVRLASTTTSNVVTYTVVVSVNNDSGILKPGMTANVSIITNKKENILCVNNAAMRFTPLEITGGKKFEHQGIWLLRENRPIRINIETGLNDSEITEIISEEIEEGEEVIIGKLEKKDKKNSQSRPHGMF